MKTERKSTGVVIKQVDEVGGFEAAIATFDEIDSDGDIVKPGAFGGATVSILPSHDQGHVPLGKTTVEDRGNLAIAVGQFNLDVAPARDWHSSIKFDLDNPPSVQEWSWGFRPVEFSFEEIDGVQVRILSKVDLREVSPVLRGASVGSATLSVKSEAAHKSETSDALWDGVTQERLIEGKSSSHYAIMCGTKGHFLHHFTEEDGSMGAASVRACLMGIASLKGVRGASMLLSKEQRQGVYDHLAAHLKDAGVEVPDLGELPGIKLLTQIELATWDVETVIARLVEVSDGRPLGKTSKVAALKMAECTSELMTQLRVMAERMLPEDEAARAAATFLATDAARHLS